MEHEHRTIVAALSLSALGLIGVAINEGYTSNAIPDPAHGTAVPTIGFGQTQGVKMGDTTTPPEALKRLGESLTTYEKTVQSCVDVPLYQHEYDVYVDLAYNIGSESFCRSTIVKKLNEWDYKGACDAILMWNRAGQHDCRTSSNCKGLWIRRLEAHKKCLAAPVIVSDALAKPREPLPPPASVSSSSKDGSDVAEFAGDLLLLQVLILFVGLLAGFFASKLLLRSEKWMSNWTWNWNKKP